MYPYLKIFLILLVLPACSFAQNSNNYIEVISNAALNWNINTAGEVQNDQPIADAITLRVKNRSNPGPRSVNVRVSNFTTPTGFSAPFIPLKLHYASDNSPNETNLVTSKLQLTTTGQRLFLHNKHANNSSYIFNYDLLLAETDWNFPPGTYNYTLTFTFDYP